MKSKSFLSIQLPILFSGQASFAQERIFLDEHIRFRSQGNRMYTVPLAYRISSNTNFVSITRLHRAIETLIIKHAILRTTLEIDTNNVITQSLLDIIKSDEAF